MLSSKDDWMELYARAYATHLSLEELNTLAQFYESAAGQRYLAAMPDIISDNVSAGRIHARDVLGPRVQARVAALLAQPRQQHP